MKRNDGRRSAFDLVDLESEPFGEAEHSGIGGGHEPVQQLHAARRADVDQLLKEDSA